MPCRVLSLLERASYLQGASEKMESTRQPLSNLKDESRWDLNQPCLFKPLGPRHSIYSSRNLIFNPKILWGYHGWLMSACHDWAAFTKATFSPCFFSRWLSRDFRAANDFIAHCSIYPYKSPSNIYRYPTRTRVIEAQHYQIEEKFILVQRIFLGYLHDLLFFFIFYSIVFCEL